MKISTRGRYALRIMLDLAEHGNGVFVPLKEVADRQDLSLKYIEKILPVFKKAGYIEGVHGKGGGYRLVKSPDAYTVGDILRLAEADNLAPVACLEGCAAPCPRKATCKTLPMWKKLHVVINRFVDGITLADLLAEQTIDL